MSFSYVNKHNFQIRPQLSNLQEHVKSRHDEYDNVIQRTEDLENYLNKYVSKLYDLEKRFSEFKTSSEKFDKDVDERVIKQRGDFETTHRSSEYRLAGVRNELLGITNEIKNSLTSFNGLEQRVVSQLASVTDVNPLLATLTAEIKTLNTRVEELAKLPEEIRTAFDRLQRIETRIDTLEEVVDPTATPKGFDEEQNEEQNE